jgi:hypothetical protein
VSTVIDQPAVVVRARIGMHFVRAVRFSECVLYGRLVGRILEFVELVRAIDASVSRIAHWLFVFRLSAIVA